MLRRLLPLLLCGACLGESGRQQTSPPPADSARPPRDAQRAQAQARRDSLPAAAPLVPTPDTLRGLYVNRWAAIGPRMWRLIEIARTTEVNALVIDVKDDRGLVLYRSSV